MIDPLFKITFVINPSYGNRSGIILRENHFYYTDNLGFEHRFIIKNAKFESTLSADDYERLIGDIKNTTIPLVPPYSGGLDGTTFEIDIENGFNKASYKWWCECPDIWKPLESLADRLLEYARKLQNR
jgi:hypothetical protein